MQSFLLMTLTLFTANALAISIVPERIVTPPLSLFHSSNKEVEPGQMSVLMTKYDKKGEFRRSRERMILPKEKYEAFSKLASAVYEMVPDDRYPVDDENRGRRGTAFHIGHNLVLTNAHVLSKGFYNTTQCADFQLKAPDSRDKFDCERVHFCNVRHDVCLIEMRSFTRGWGRNRVEISMARGAALKLKSQWSPVFEERNKVILTAIGNSKGLGIHLSQGRGVLKSFSEMYFWAPITGGNSGGALINEEGLVVGVVKQESKVKISDHHEEAFNVASTTEQVISLVRQALRDDPETLEKFNQSVVE